MIALALLSACGDESATAAPASGGGGTITAAAARPDKRGYQIFADPVQVDIDRIQGRLGKGGRVTFSVQLGPQLGTPDASNLYDLNLADDKGHGIAVRWPADVDSAARIPNHLVRLYCLAPGDLTPSGHTILIVEQAEAM